jgi:hypothetical protein
MESLGRKNQVNIIRRASVTHQTEIETGVIFSSAGQKLTSKS